MATTRQNFAVRLTLCLLFMTGMIVLWLVWEKAFAKGMSIENKLVFLFLLGTISLTFVLLEKPFFLDLFATIRGKGSWHTLDAGNTFNVLLTLLLMLSAIIDMMAPRTSIESDPGVIETMVNAVSAKADLLLAGQGRIENGIQQANQKLSQIAVSPGDARARIAGQWGERGSNCRIVYTISISDHAIRITAPANFDQIPIPAINETGTITGESNTRDAYVINSFTDDGIRRVDEGKAATFTYREGGVEHLEWRNNAIGVITDLTRC